MSTQNNMEVSPDFGCMAYCCELHMTATGGRDGKVNDL